MIGNDIDLKGTLAFKGERGYSAFEIAKQHGWTGTEEDWLANLGTSSHFEECSDIYTATAGQTIFALPECYTSNSYVDVYVNGSRKNSDEYMINTSSETIVLAEGLNSGDKVEVITLTMSTNELPIVQNITSSSTSSTVPSAECVYKNLDIYYDNISIEKYRDNTSNTDYYITTIPSAYKNKIKLGLANDTLGNTLESTLDFATRKKTTLCINAGIAGTNNRAMGTIIKDGVILQNTTYATEGFDFLGIKSDGTLKAYASNVTSGETMLADGIVNAFLGFYCIIRNGSNIAKTDDNSINVNPRQVIAQKSDGTILILTCDGRTKYSTGMTTADVQRILATYNVDFAYMLDGGGSTSTVLKGIKQNKNIDNRTDDRKVSSYLYLAVDNTTKELANCYGEIGKLKQELNRMIEKFVDVNEGYLNLYTPENALYPGISFFPNGETNSRAGKLITNYNNGFYVTHRANVSDTEKTVIRADQNGIYDIDGLLGNFKDIPKTLTTCDIQDFKSGIYLATGSTINSPVSSGYSYILNLKLNNANYIKQISIPATDSNVYFRRYSEGLWSSWQPFNIYRGSTANRPVNPLQGTMYFDTTLSKPIWYGGGSWLDASGNVV